MSNVQFLKSFTAKKSNKLYNKDQRLATNLTNPPKVSSFDLSFSHTTTFNNSKLIPIAFLECLPGDTYNIDINAVIRQSAPKAATLENPNVDFSAFFVPYNVIWQEWKYLMGETKNAGYVPEVKKTPVMIYDKDFKYSEGDVASYLGIPQNVNMKNTGVPINALPFKGYVQIWNDWFRDENLQSEADNTNNNRNNEDVKVSDYWDEDYNLSLQVGKGLAPVSRLPDYFSTCLPWPQAGQNVDIFTGYGIDLSKLGLFNAGLNGNYVSPWVGLNPGGYASARVTGYNKPDNVFNNWPKFQNGGVTSTSELFDTNPYMTGSNFYLNNLGYAGSNAVMSASYTSGTAAGGKVWPIVNLSNIGISSAPFNPRTDVYPGSAEAFKGVPEQFAKIESTADSLGFNINDLRGAIALQHFNETNARGGRRYIEILKTHFGVNAPADGLYRSEYIGGFRQPLTMNNVIQSSSGGSDQPLGSIGGYSITSIGNKSVINYSSKVHGYIYVLATVRPQVKYSQGLPKIFTKTEMLDYYFPAFANIGEQPVYNYELYLSDTPVTAERTNNLTFGFNEAFADYRYQPSKLSGFMSVNSPTSLAAYYTYSEKYTGVPVLNNSWMVSNPDVISSTMLFNANQVEFIHDYLADFYFKIVATRPLPVVSIPGISKI